MKTNSTSYFTKNDVTHFLIREFNQDAQTLFSLKQTNPEKYLEIVDMVFKRFCNHWMNKETGELVTEHPQDPLIQFFVYGYPGYHSIEDLQDLVSHMHNAHILRAERISEFNHIIQKEQSDLEL
jgi:G3E family GTPase